MSIEALKNRLPDYAKDLKLNLGVARRPRPCSTDSRRPARSSPARSPRATPR